MTTVPAALAARIQRFIAANEFTGAAVLVLKHGQIVCEHYAGEAAPGIPATADTLWPLASISKVYSAATIMRMVELGEITLNTRATSLFPAFCGGERDTVRIRHLLTHTAGLMYESPEMAMRLRNQTSLSDMLDEALESPLLYTPGTTVSYSDYHWLILAHIAEHILGMSFVDAMRTLLLDPMGLQQTYFPVGAAGPVAYVRGALAEGTSGDMYNSAYGHSLAHPAFGVVASARDVARFAMHFMPGGPRVLAEPTVWAMTHDQTAGVGGHYPILDGIGTPRHSWGIGWALQTATTPALFSELLSFDTFGHHGASGCQVMADPHHDLVLVTLTNTHLNTGMDRWYDRLQAIAACAIASVMVPVR